MRSHLSWLRPPTASRDMAEVVVVGSLNMDLAVAAPRLPRAGETILGTEFSMVPGGKGNNQVIACARQGAATAMVGRLGNDRFAAQILDLLRAEGVDASHVSTDPELDTGVAQIVVSATGENTIVVVPLANSTLDQARIEAARPLLIGARVLLSQLEIPLPAVAASLRIARALGLTTMLNPAPARELDDGLMGLVDVCLPNQAEATTLTGEDASSVEGALRAARRLRERGCRAAVVTLGKLGCVWADSQGAFEMAAIPADAVDTVAAGDAFCGALAAAVAQGLSLRAALARATAAGSLATTVKGATSSLPSREAVDRLLARVGSPEIRAH
ncbi:MAG: ribokinase [Candidatus Dormibacteria bacterium]